MLIASFMPLCWLAMMALHEVGHVLAAWCSGGTVVKVVLHPFAISRTDVSPNPRPLIVAWAGPMAGVLLPVLIGSVAYMSKSRFLYLFRFFTGFCLIANGAYIGVGSIDMVGDAGEIIRHGSPRWLLWLFGVVTVPSGVLLWHRLGSHFGLGEARGRVDVRAAYVSCCMLLVTSVVLFALSPRS